MLEWSECRALARHERWRAFWWRPSSNSAGILRGKAIPEKNARREVVDIVRGLYWECSTRSHSEHGSEISQGRW